MLQDQHSMNTYLRIKPVIIYTAILALYEHPLENQYVAGVKTVHIKGSPLDPTLIPV